MSSKFSSNSEADASELLGNLEDMLPRYWYEQVSKLKFYHNTSSP